MWAAFNLRAARMGARIAAELGSGSAGLARLRAVFDEQWDVLEIGAMSLGFEDVMSALVGDPHVAAGGVDSKAPGIVEAVGVATAVAPRP